MHVSNHSPAVGMATANVPGRKADAPTPHGLKPHGKDQNPASQARALISQNAALQDRPFGKIVSALARHLPVEGPPVEAPAAEESSPPEEAPATPVVDAAPPAPADGESATGTGDSQITPVDISV